MNLYWDYTNKQLAASLTKNIVFSRLDWILRDQLAITLTLVTPKSTGFGYVAATIPAGYLPIFALKQAGHFANAALASQASWTGSGSAFTATINLNTVALTALVDAAAAGYVDLVAEFALDNGSGVQTDSTQIACRVTQDVNRDGEAAPAAATAQGVFLPNRTTGLWHYTWLEGATNPVLCIGEGVAR